LLKYLKPQWFVVGLGVIYFGEGVGGFFFFKENGQSIFT